MTAILNAFIISSEYWDSFPETITCEYDITNELKTMCGENFDWNNGTLYKASMLNNNDFIGKTLYILYDKYDKHGNPNYNVVKLENENTIINPPLNWSFECEKLLYPEANLDTNLDTYFNNLTI